MTDQLHMPIKVQPYRHQREAFDFACSLFGMQMGNGGDTKPNNSCSLLMEMGTGKTLVSIALAGALYQQRNIRKVLIVAPLSILGVWDDEFRKFADFEYDLTILTGSSEKKSSQLHNMKSDLMIAVINYESAWRIENEIMMWKPDLVIADESHKMKSHRANVSKSMHRIGAKTSYKLMLTGTVITNKALDIFSQYKFLAPNIFNTSFYAFRNHYFDLVGYGGYTPVLKKSMEAELTRKLHSIAYRATKMECLDLPPTTDIVRYVELEPKAVKIYRDLVKDSYTELGQGEVTATNVLTRLLRLSQVTGGFINTDDGKSSQNISMAKLNALEDIIEESVNEGKKIVVIARFIAEITAICKLLDKHRIGYACIMGEVKDRTEQVERFQTNPDVQVFVGQIATAGLGITLTAASTMVFYSEDYSMSNFEQAKARIHRVGQSENCSYIYLVAKGTVDEKVLMALRDKADLAKTLIDDYRKGINPYE